MFISSSRFFAPGGVGSAISGTQGPGERFSRAPCFRGGLAPGLLACVLALGVGAACGAPKGRIADSSKTKECSTELLSALNAAKNDLGLAFAVSPADADSIFKTGKVTKEYARDGAQFKVFFGLEKKDGGCHLKLFKRVESRPGRTSTSSGDFGRVELKVCKCK